MTPYRWLSMAFEIFPDASDLAAALFALRGTDGLNEADAEKIDQVYQVLLATEGRQKVLAGVNAAASALHFAPRMAQSPASLRQTYRLLVMTTLTEHVMYRYLIETFGFSHRHQVIDYLEAALACDIRSTEPSCTQEEFSQLWQVLYQLRLLRAADIVFLGKTQRDRKRSVRVRKKPSARRCAQQDVQQTVPSDTSQKMPQSDDERLIHLLLSGLADASTLSDRVVEAYDAMHATQHRLPLSAFLQRLFNAFRMMPIELFATIDHRDAVLDILGEPLKTLHFPGGLIGARGYIDA
jgi:type III secretion protein W